MQGWIKVHRELMEKPIWVESTPEQKTVLMTILMMASHQEKQWEWKGKPYKIAPGQFITSLESIAQKCGKGISIQNVRTSLKRFEKYDFLTNESTNKNRLITIVNWAFYQSNEEELTDKPTSSQQATNKQLTTIKNDKELKNDKEENIIAEIKDLRLSYSSEIQSLIDQYWKVVKQTRKSNQISYNVILKTMRQWKKYDQVVIQYALNKHLTAYADEEHDEKYTLGIIRNTTPEKAADLLNKKHHHNQKKGAEKHEKSQYSAIF